MAVTRPAYRYAAAVVRTIDGDTMQMRIDVGFHVSVETPVRLLGWSCPELSEPLGPEAKAEADALLRGAMRVIVETEKDSQTFGRWLARIWVDGVELGAILADRGLARLGR